ncbi:ABC transporter permease subunit [Microbispora amethystogenes]|uniref:ABC transporter permease n=1 Tax=Microbispora amethystogenes TaxID=1427754 RepID=UPI0033D8D7B3
MPSPALRGRAHRTATALLGGVLLVSAALLVWDRFGAAGPEAIWPVLTGRRELLTEAAGVTLLEAAYGLVAGTALAVVAAWSAGAAAGARGPLQLLMLICYALPLVALGPLLTSSVQREAIPVIAAAISVALPVFSAAEAGLKAIPRGLRDLLAVHGAGRWRRLRLVEAAGALPYVVEGIKFAVPGALLGALIGEWFGAERGLGVLLVSGLRDGQDDLVATVSVLVVAMSSIVYAVFARLARTVHRRRGTTGSAA